MYYLYKYVLFNFLICNRKNGKLKVGIKSNYQFNSIKAILEFLIKALGKKM